MLPFLIVGESTTVALSPPRPSSEDAVPGTERLCLEMILVGMLGKRPETLMLVILGGMSHARSHQRTHTRTTAKASGTDVRARCEEAGQKLVSRAGPVGIEAKKTLPVCAHAGATVPGGRAVDARVNPDVGRAISTNIILIGAELSPLGRDALQLLLGGSVRVPNLHQHSFFANGSTVVLPDDVFALIASLESVQESVGKCVKG